MSVDLFFNHSITVNDKKLIEQGKTIPSVPFGKDEHLLHDARYKDKRGIVVTMRALHPANPVAQHGFFFQSDRGVYYRPNGSTMDENDKCELDDIAERVT